MVNKKRAGMMIAVTLLIGVLLFCSVFFLVRRANREITQRSFDELATATRQIAKDLADAANADQTILSAMAELIAGHDERDNDAVLRIMKSFSLSETFVSTVALLRPDGTLLLTDGARYDVSGAFERLKVVSCDQLLRLILPSENKIGNVSSFRQPKCLGRSGRIVLFRSLRREIRKTETRVRTDSV